MWCQLTDQKCGRLTGIWVYTFCVQMELTSWISNKICWFKLWCFKCCQHTCFMEYSFDNNQEMWNCLCGYPRNQEKPDPDDQDVVASVEGPLFLVIIISRSEASASKWFSFRVWQPSPGLFFHFLSTCMYVCVPGQQFVLRVLENNSTHCVASTVQVHHGKFVIPLYLMSLREKEACVEWCRISVELHLMGCGQEALVLHHQYCI